MRAQILLAGGHRRNGRRKIKTRRKRPARRSSARFPRTASATTRSATERSVRNDRKLQILVDPIGRTRVEFVHRRNYRNGIQPSRLVVLVFTNHFRLQRRFLLTSRAPRDPVTDLTNILFIVIGFLDSFSPGRPEKIV